MEVSGSREVATRETSSVVLSVVYSRVVKREVW